MMKKELTFLLIVMVAVIFLCVITLLVVTFPSFWPQLNLATSNTSNIGSTIGGVTAPVIGIITVYFLYSTLQKQIDATIKQDIKNDTDLVFLLLNQLDVEVSNFKYKFQRKRSSGTTTESENFEFTGWEALNVYSSKFSVGEHWPLSTNQYGETKHAKELQYIVKSFTILFKRAMAIDSKSEMRLLLKEKLLLYFDTKLQHPIKLIINHVKDKHPDSYDSVVKDFENLFLEVDKWS